MAEQQSRRANPVTTAPIDSAFETQLVQLGRKGLNIKDDIAALDPGQFSRMTNVDHDADGNVQARPGQTAFASAGGTHHSVRKLRDPETGSTTRVWGIGGSLFIGASGGLAGIDAGYSGNPLALVPHRPPLSGDSWMFVGDSARMRKVRTDGLVVQIGLPAPGAPGVALGTEYRTTIAQFEAADGTQASAWTGVAGTDDKGNDSGVPIAEDDCATAPVAGCAVRFRTTVGAAVSTYDNWWGIPLSRDLTQVTPVGGGGAIPASDDDIIHFWMFFSLPHLIEEMRIYFVISNTFNANVLPGTATDAGNDDAYVKSIRQNDFSDFIQGKLAQIDAAETSRIRGLRDRDLIDRRIPDVRSSWAELRAVTDPARALSLAASSGSYQWLEFGTVGLPLRRGDFQRIGVSAGRDWSTITGLVIYVRMAIDKINTTGVVGMDDLYLTGGFGPDTSEPGAQQYDYKVTHYDPRTGAESNGSDEMNEANFVDSVRRQIIVSPPGFGDGNIRQRIYRRGGSLIDDWFFCGQNGSDGGAFTDTLTDDAIAAAGSVPNDHFQPVPTVDDAGNTVLAQPVPALWGPVEGMLFACGDPHRPGHVYFCIPDEPDHWSASGLVEVCPPSEELMNGGLLGHQAFVLSREALYMLYPNLSGVGIVTSAPTLCKRGLWSRWGMVVGPKGVYFVAEDGIFVSAGGEEDWISREIDPLFRGDTKNGYAPINKAAVSTIRLSIWENKLYFQYTDTNGAQQIMVYAILHDFWRHYDFGVDPFNVQGQGEDILLIGAVNATYLHSGTSDNGLAIAALFRTPAFNGATRSEKLFGDMIVDADRQNVTISLTNYLNEETVANPAQTLIEGIGRNRFVIDAFGTSPQKARSISTEIAWSTTGPSPIIYQLGYAIILQPDLTTNRVTNWDDLGSADEVWLTGVTFDCDTGGNDLLVTIERDFGGVIEEVTNFFVNAAGRHKFKFSWLAVPAHKVRVRPSDQCAFWMLYRADWIWQEEPPRISKWDVHFENRWDQYYTGLDLYCDTGGVQKDIVCTVDETVLINPATGLGSFPVVASGRRVVHLTFTPGRGPVLRFYATDDNPGLLYNHRWHTDPEPSEQANWNQNFSIYGTRADKYLKAIIFECDTFGQTKQVRVEVDNTLVETLQVTANGRLVVQKTLTQQRLGRVWRILPADTNPGRLYTVQPIFDEEPFQLDRWETQETNHNLPGWFYPLDGHVTLKSTATVTLAITLQINQRGTLVTEEYEIPSTAGAKVRTFVGLRSNRGGKGVLIKYLLTSSAPFFLYREETNVRIQPWGAPDAITVQPFGDDDLDPTRPMRQATLAAAAPGGQLGEE